MASATVVKIQRNSVNEPWGMKIAGGRDFRMQLQVKKVSCSLSLSISHLYLSASSFGCNIRPSCFANDMPYNHTCITGVHERYLVSQSRWGNVYVIMIGQTSGYDIHIIVSNYRYIGTSSIQPARRGMLVRNNGFAVLLSNRSTVLKVLWISKTC